jgi:hypothetical protein
MNHCLNSYVNLILRIMLFLINDKLTAYDSSALDKKNTGLGNVLFQVATAYGLGKLLNREVYYTNVFLFNERLKERFTYDYSKTIFRNCIEVAPIEIDSFVRVDEGTHRTYNAEFLRTIDKISSHVKINGYFEVPHYFLQCMDQIQDLFSVDESTRAEIILKYPQIADDSFTCISLHFRLSGFGEDLQMGLNYYTRAIEYILKNVKNPMFFLFTDDIHAFNQKYSDIFAVINKYPHTLVKNNLDYVDLWLMSLCRHNIICKSTFSFWGAFLNKNKDKIVLVPNDGPSFVSFIENNHPIS